MPSQLILTLLSFRAWRSLKPFQTHGALGPREPWFPLDDAEWTRGARGAGKTCGNQGGRWSVSLSTLEAETASDVKPNQEQCFSKRESRSDTQVTRRSQDSGICSRLLSNLKSCLLGTGRDSGQQCQLSAPLGMPRQTPCGEAQPSEGLASHLGSLTRGIRMFALIFFPETRLTAHQSHWS